MADMKFPSADNDREDTAGAIVAYQTAACAKEDPGRIAKFVEAEDARLTIGSKPWCAPLVGGNPLSPFFEPIKVEDDRIKLANRNEVAPIMDSETARLIGSTSTPNVEPDAPTTVVHRAAKKAEAVLDDILYTARWTDKLHRHAKNVINYGTSHLLSGWETDYTQKVEGPAKVHACGCGWKMRADGGEPAEGGGYRFSGDIAREMVEAKVGSSVSQPFDEDVFATIRECPECNGALQTRRALPKDGEMDAFGYELVERTPLPRVFIQHFADIDVFMVGGGRSFDGFCPEYTIETIVPKDWLLERYEHAHKVEAVSLGTLDEMARWHPAGLEMWGYSGHGLANDQKRWAPYRITVRQPFGRADQSPADEIEDDDQDRRLGRLMISANKTVLYNGPLMFEYTTTKGVEKLIPRMKLFTFANELQNNTQTGLSVYSRIAGPQKSLDAMMTQFQWDMAENGSPTLALPFSANIEGQGDGMEDDDDEANGVPNKIIRYDGTQGKVEVVGGQVTHSDWQPFSDGIVQHMQRATAQSQLDQGKAASGAPSATAQQYIGQRLDETRKPKGQRWAEHLSELFSYDTEIVCAVYTDRRQFKVFDKFDHRTVRDFAGADLMGQFNVKVTTKPAHDNDAFQRANILEVLALPVPLIDTSTPRKRLLIGKKLGIEEELDSEPNQQIRDAGNEFLDYTLADPPKKPIAKKRTDDHPLHIQTHMEDLRSPAGEAMTRMWPQHELATYGSFDEFKALMMAETRLKTMPAPEPVVILDVAAGAPDVRAMTAQAEAYAADQKLRAQLEAMPKTPQERLEKLQVGMVEKYIAENALPPDDAKDLLELTVWLAHKDAHEWFVLEAAQAAAPPPQATQPTPGSPQAPAAPAAA